VAVTDAAADVDGDGDMDGDDDGTNSGVDFIDGKVDLDGDGDVDGDDDGAFPRGASPADAQVIDGNIDLSGDGSADDDDDGLLTVLQLPTSWNDVPAHHIISAVDDGTYATVAGRLMTLSSGALDFDSPGVIDGRLDLNNDWVVDGGRWHRGGGPDCHRRDRHGRGQRRRLRRRRQGFGRGSLTARST
jgi:hypothetical protein